MVFVSFALNWIWEMLQMPSYKEMAGRPLQVMAARCSFASLGDVAIIFSIYAVGALAAARLGWGLRARWNVYSTIALLGAMNAFWIERAAITSGRWTYNDTMPVIPLLNVGLWPVLQLAALAPFVVWLSSGFASYKREH